MRGVAGMCQHAKQLSWCLNEVQVLALRRAVTADMTEELQV